MDLTGWTLDRTADVPKNANYVCASPCKKNKDCHSPSKLARIMPNLHSMKKLTYALLAAAVLAGAGNGFTRELEQFTTEEVVTEKKTVKVQANPSSAFPSNPNAQYVKLRVGEIRPAIESKGSLFAAAPEAFYLPAEAIGVVQLIVEKKGATTTYFLKGLRKGKTVGGVVQRAWLDKSGFKPKTITDEGRIQQALKANPFYITVE